MFGSLLISLLLGLFSAMNSMNGSVTTQFTVKQFRELQLEYQNINSIAAMYFTTEVEMQYLKISSRLQNVHLPSVRIFSMQSIDNVQLQNGDANCESVPPNAIPTSDCLMAAQSLAPSPIIPTFLPSFWSSSTLISFQLGFILAKTMDLSKMD